MSRRQFLEVTCDDCGYVGRWEWLAFGEFLPGVASANAREMVLRNGWTIVPVEDAETRSRDLCPSCSKRAKRKQRQPELRIDCRQESDTHQPLQDAQQQQERKGEG